MKFLMNCIREKYDIRCWVITLDSHIVLNDGCEYEEQAIEIDKNDDVLNDIVELFKEMNIVFDYYEYILTGLSGRMKPVYRLKNFRRI